MSSKLQGEAGFPIKQSKELSIRMGALSPPITEQLRNQEFDYGAKSGQIFDRAKKEIAFLCIQGFLPDSEARKAEKRLFKRIKDHVEGRLTSRLSGQ